MPLAFQRMNINVEAYIQCEICADPKEYSESYVDEDFEDIVPNEFEDSAIDWFKNQGWTRQQSGNWRCPEHK